MPPALPSAPLDWFLGARYNGSMNSHFLGPNRDLPEQLNVKPYGPNISETECTDPLCVCRWLPTSLFENSKSGHGRPPQTAKETEA